MAMCKLPHPLKMLSCVFILAATSACSSQPYDPDRTAAALMILGGGMQNYGAARAAAYQAVYQSTYCYPVGRGYTCN